MPFVDLVEFHSFIGRDIRSGDTVLDLGANRGRYSQKMKDRYGATCYAVEASPGIFRDLEAAEVATCFNIAMHDHVGEISLKLSDNELAATVFDTSKESNMGTVTVPCSDLESFVGQAGIDRIDLLKIDIEGAEIPMLKACSDAFLKTIPQITIEFHDFCGITSGTEVEACLRRFRALGFDTIRFSRVGHQDTLLINRALVNVSAIELFYIRYIYRNVKGLLRIGRKLIYGRKWAEGYS